MTMKLTDRPPSWPIRVCSHCRPCLFPLARRAMPLRKVTPYGAADGRRIAASVYSGMIAANAGSLKLNI